MAIRAIHIVAGLHPRSGGPSRTVIELTDALAMLPGCDTYLLSQRSKGDPIAASGNRKVVRRIVELGTNLGAIHGLGIRREIEEQVGREGDMVVHAHGVWLAPNLWASRLAHSRSIPVVIQPRGMLEPWALNNNRWKKRIALAIWQRRALERAALLVATSDMEYESLRSLGLIQPIAIIPNGVPRCEGEEPPEDNEAREEPRTVLFLSRIHPKKGLGLLIEAWRRLDTVGWRLRIAGPDDGGHLDHVLWMVERLGVGHNVSYVGEVDGAAKWREFERASLFVLPTFSENFGVVVVEALSHGLPVVCSRGAPWKSLVENGCGWWVNPDIEGIAAALKDAMALTDGERGLMGARGRALARRFDWARIAEETFECYQWLTGGGGPPTCVHPE